MKCVSALCRMNSTLVGQMGNIFNLVAGLKVMHSLRTVYYWTLMDSGKHLIVILINRVLYATTQEVCEIQIFKFLNYCQPREWWNLGGVVGNYEEHNHVLFTRKFVMKICIQVDYIWIILSLIYYFKYVLSLSPDNGNCLVLSPH